MDNILQHPRLLTPRNCMNIPNNWLELEIFELLKYPFKLDKFELYDNNERVCICKFIKNYEKGISLNRYFSKPNFCNYHSKVFGSMHYLRRFNDEECKKLSNIDQMDDFSISDTTKTAVANNALYSQIILTNLTNQGDPNTNTTSPSPTFSHTHGGRKFDEDRGQGDNKRDEST